VAYRAQTYIERSAERCFCDSTEVVRCRCCRRPRCAAHRERGLCTRCGQALERRRPALADAAWWIGGGVGLAAAAILVPLGVFVPSLPLVGLWVAMAPLLAVVGGLVGHRVVVRREIARLRPWLSTTLGELPAPELEPAWPDAPPAVSPPTSF